MLFMISPFKIFRDKTSMSQSKLGELLGLTQSCICQYETKVRVPRVSHACEFIVIAKSYGLQFTLEDILVP